MWAGAFSPRSLWSPWSEEKHCDHMAAAGLARDLAGRLEPQPLTMDYLVWGWTMAALARTAEKIWALDCPDTVDRRRRALARHRTQTSNVIVDADQGFQIPSQLAALTERPFEIYLERS
jgi:LmbE family N-acetylglucosaminyl deacetylase